MTTATNTVRGFYAALAAGDALTARGLMGDNH